MAFKNRHTILLVDDEKAITNSLRRLFRKQGYAILTASSGYEALDALRNLKEPISLIISDQRMPGMSGTQFLEKAKVICPEAVRYLLTGYSDMDDVANAIKNGCVHRYLTKPWDDADLLNHVRLSLEQAIQSQKNK